MCSAEKNRRKAEEALKKLRPIDDNFFRELFRDNIELTEFVLRIFMDKPDLKVTEQETQYDLKRLLGARSVCLDVKATDSEGRKINIEVQRSTAGANPHRARYHLSALDVEHLDANRDFSELPETYIIFITETDIFGAGEAVYPIERINTKTNKLFNDGEHIIYINASYKDDTTPLGKLLHDFLCSDPNEMKTPELAERTRTFKEIPKGVSYMCEIIEKLQEERAAEAALKNSLDIALNFLKLGKFTVTEICAGTQLPFDTVKQLAIDNNIAYTV